VAKRVVIDPGHGGSDPGAVANQLREKDLTLTISKRIRAALLRDYEVEVDLTRSTDIDVSLQARSAFANRLGADFFLSVHINSGGGEGYEDFIHRDLADTSAAAGLRSVLHDAITPIIRRHGLRDRGKKKANFSVLRETRMPAVLTENLFIDNTADAALLRGDAFLAEVAEAHVSGIARALTLRRKQEVVVPATRMLAGPRVAVSGARSYVVSRQHGDYTDGDVSGIVGLYFDTARAVGLDPLLAISQMVLETANLSSFWSQRPRRNPAGIGVTGAAGVGLSFPSWSVAVRAHVGRLLAYALGRGMENDRQRELIAEALSWRALPDRLRGVAPTLAGLAGTWAADREYAVKISRIANDIRASA
jgi:N-acetylmuramoyl-L-alanine amidase